MNTVTFWKGAAFVSIVMLISMVIVSAGIVVLVFLLRKPMREFKWIDLMVFNWLDARTSPARNKFIQVITFLGNHLFLAPAYLLLLLYFLFIGNNSWFSVRIAAIAISSLLMMLILKALFRRKRPLGPLIKAVKGLSFPSGHAIMSVSFYGLLIYILYSTVKDDSLKNFGIFFLVILILLIGFSRIYLRVHYLSDVLAGFVIGTLWLMISLAVLNWAESNLKEKTTSSTNSFTLPYILL